MARPKAGYRTLAGDKVPGVTTVIGRFKESGGLLYWANRLALEPLLKARSLMQQSLDGSDMRVQFSEFLDEDPDGFDHMKSRDKAADAGTLAHAMIEAYLKGEDLDACVSSEHTPDVIGKAETSVLSFLEWAGQTNLEVVESELSLISEELQVGGTLDCCVLSVNGNLCIGDFKTGSGVYPDALVQVAAYGMMYKELHPEVKIHGYYIIRFDRDTANHAVRFYNELQKGERAFVLMRELYDLMKDLGKLAK